MAHRWHFFRAGGVDQVSLRDRDDLTAIRNLDQKLWVALAMPTTGVDLDAKTLALLDVDKDHRIRVYDIREAVAWIDHTFARPDDVLVSADEVKLVALSDAKVVAAAKRMLKDLNKPNEAAISVADVTAIEQAFADTVLNGDGIVIPKSTNDPDLQKAISDAIECVGSAVDRSGIAGVNQPKVDQFFAEIDARAAWLASGKDPALVTLGDRTAAAYDALTAVRAKLDDYFTRCRVAAFEPRGAVALAAGDAELAALATRSLSADDVELARLPLAALGPEARLALGSTINPAWAARIAAFKTAAVAPILGPREVLVPADLEAIVDKLAAYTAWRAAEPVSKVASLDTAWVERLAGPELRSALAKLVAEDAALADEYDQITSVVKAVRFQRDFGRIARNFISFSDFYSKQDGVFQAGTLYLDARALHLCVPVVDAANHAILAAASDAFLIYCDLSHDGKTQQIAAALTNGDDDNVFVGRNGVFYDREGKGWDATVTKIIANPIGIRQAFWSPYKKLVKTIEGYVTKRAQSADAEAAAKIDAAGKEVANVDTAAVRPVPDKIDLGTVAAIGVAIGGVGTLVGALLAVMFGLGPWLPLGLVALILMISGPSMVLAWLKLRRRNLGPILDANGWAINSRARINVAFGAAMTELAKLPPGSQRSLSDPFADRRVPWRRWVFVSAVLLLGGSWYVGKLDKYLPEDFRSVTVLGSHAPAFISKAGAPAAPPAAPAAPPAAPAPPAVTK